MNTLRLTYSPYGFGRVLRVVQPRETTESNQADEKGASKSQPQASQHRKSGTDDDEP
jgi:hypothetical protein